MGQILDCFNMMIVLDGLNMTYFRADVSLIPAISASVVQYGDSISHHLAQVLSSSMLLVDCGFLSKSSHTGALSMVLPVYIVRRAKVHKRY